MIGIISIVGICCLGGFLGIVGVILGIIAVSDNHCNRKAQAIIGLCLSALAVVLTVIFLIVGSDDNKESNSQNLEVMTEMETSNNANNNLSGEDNTNAEDTTTLITETIDIEETTTPSDNSNLNAIIYNNNNIKIYFTGVEEDWIGTKMKFKVENNTATEISVQIDSVDVNGYDVPTWLYITADAGLKAVDNFYITDAELEDIGVTKIDKVVCKFRIVNMDTYREIDSFSVTLN